VAPNIYYLGYSGVINFGGIRIGGFSGIHKPYDFDKGPPALRPTKSLKVTLKQNLTMRAQSEVLFT